MSSYGPPIPPPGWGGGGGGGGVGSGGAEGIENGTNRNLVPAFLFDFLRHYRPILHRLATLHNRANRQTERGQQAAYVRASAA